MKKENNEQSPTSAAILGKKKTNKRTTAPRFRNRCSICGSVGNHASRRWPTYRLGCHSHASLRPVILIISESDSRNRTDIPRAADRHGATILVSLISDTNQTRAARACAKLGRLVDRSQTLDRYIPLIGLDRSRELYTEVIPDLNPRAIIIIGTDLRVARVIEFGCEDICWYVLHDSIRENFTMAGIKISNMERLAKHEWRPAHPAQEGVSL